MKYSIAILVVVLAVASSSTAQAGWPHKPKQPASVLIPPAPPTFGFSTPAPYPYGWFGAQYRTRRFDQRSFYGDYIQHGYWQGYY